MTPGVRRFFEDMDRAMMELSVSERHDVAALLRIMRGPDHDDSHWMQADDVKARYTAPIRDKLFPRGGCYFGFSSAAAVPRKVQDIPDRGISRHFTDSLLYAVSAFWREEA